jgi:hypothetical protein
MAASNRSSSFEASRVPECVYTVEDSAFHHDSRRCGTACFDRQLMLIRTLRKAGLMVRLSMTAIRSQPV